MFSMIQYDRQSDGQGDAYSLQTKLLWTLIIMKYSMPRHDASNSNIDIKAEQGTLKGSLMNSTCNINRKGCKKWKIANMKRHNSDTITLNKKQHYNVPFCLSLINLLSMGKEIDFFQI